MPENENLEQNTEQTNTAAAVDTGADVEELKSMIKALTTQVDALKDELKSMIKALTTQVDALKDELKRKEPEQKPPADFEAYFNSMRKKV